MKKSFVLCAVCAVLFVFLLCSLFFIDVAPVGADTSRVGYATVNTQVHRLVGVHMAWYHATEILGWIAIAVAVGFAALGLVQWIRRKKLCMVDRELFALGGLYLAVAVLYVLFEKVAVNVRPILMPGAEVAEASFPSTHTLLALTIFGSALLLLPEYVKKGVLRDILFAVGLSLLVVTVVGRFLSGVHWLTDIVGGLLLAGALLAAFSGVLGLVDKKKKAEAPSA